jgi:chemotaxis protein MotB
MFRLRQFVILASAASMLGGCVAADKYKALEKERDEYSSRLAQAEKENSTLRDKSKMLQQQLEALLAARGDESSLLATLKKQNADLMSQLDIINRKYDEAMRREPIVLPAAVSNELEKLARENPTYLEYDAKRGILKFKSDVTFASGQADLTAKAKEIIAKVASILNSPSVAQYEMLVAGHTDNVTVSNPKTIANGHKDNWYLSAHRAISVGSELRHGGINATRMGVVGYADERPVASNQSAEGKQQNRRVEVVILPPVANVAPAPVETAAPAPAPAVTASTPAVPVELNK